MGIELTFLNICGYQNLGIYTTRKVFFFGFFTGPGKKPKKTKK
jgi:hypothetical protein